MVDTLRAAYSDDHRVILYAEDHLSINHFAVYRVPVPPEFQGTAAEPFASLWRSILLSGGPGRVHRHENELPASARLFLRRSVLSFPLENSGGR
ncbi:hypothetical protein FLP41_03445 (plasmid) [Paracoccus marcusii]|uniref:hypothetical protein n=1 Tax=Paracoccus marcusii TaxID=59779 RepID=UPI002ED3DBA8|nr:hypothetical protein FLP41_03445 [Paracoccus marcusii]